MGFSHQTAGSCLAEAAQEEEDDWSRKEGRDAAGDRQRTTLRRYKRNNDVNVGVSSSFFSYKSN